MSSRVEAESRGCGCNGRTNIGMILVLFILLVIILFVAFY